VGHDTKVLVDLLAVRAEIEINSQNIHTIKNNAFSSTSTSPHAKHIWWQKKPVIRSNSNSFLTDTRPADSSFACACLIKSWHHET